MKVICISGKAQHGKDTAAQFLADALKTGGYSVLVTHYGDLLKYICKTFFDWDGEKNDEGRTLLQKVGTDVIRAQCPDYWVSFIAGIMKFFPNEWDYVLIPDCRFPDELNYLKDSGFDTVHIRVVRENFKSPLTPEQQAHPSETALDGIIPDCCIKNSGTLKDLRNAVTAFAGQHLKKYSIVTAKQ